MGLFTKKEGGIMDVIRCDEQEYLVWKWRPAGQTVNSTAKENSIRYGSTLHVKDGEMCVFVYKQNDGALQDFIMGPYEDTIKTANFPVLTSIVGVAFGGTSPFPAEVYFFNLQGNNQIKFAVPYFDVADPRFIDFTVPVSVRGTLTFTLKDVKKFISLNRLTDFDLNALREQIMGMVKKSTKRIVSNCPSEQGISVLQIERRIEDINDVLKEKIAPELEEDFGVTLKRLDISAIEIDKDSSDYKQFVHATKEQQMIQAEQVGRRAQIETDVYAESAHLGVQSQNLQAHAINQQTRVLEAAANNLGQMGAMNMGEGGGMNTAGMMMGMGVAAGMGQQMAGMMGGMNQMVQQPQMQQQTMPVAPPPMPTTVSYMLAVNGQQYGPYNMQQLQQMVASGQFTPQSMVWCNGMASWEPAASRQDLGVLFAPATPPMPPVPGGGAPMPPPIA